MTMQISVIYANPDKPLWLKAQVAPGSTVQDAIAHSGLLERVPSLDLERHKTGIFGKFAALDRPLEQGDRVEIYQPITVDPKGVPKRAQRSRSR